jgi:hypothetical protein
MSDNPKYLRLGDGDLIDTSTGKKVTGTDINRAFSDTPEKEALERAKRRSSFEQGKRRYLDDLPVPAHQCSAVALVASLTVFGLNATDIAYATKTTEDIVDQIRETEAYYKYIEGLLANIREHDTNKVRKKINESAEKAAKRITELVSSGDEKVALGASREVLDRHGSESGVATGGGKSSGLVIRIIDDRDNPHTKVKVDIE